MKLSLPLVASLVLLCCAQQAIALVVAPPPFETILDVNATSTIGPKVNREGGIATLYKTDPNGPDHLFFYGDGTATEFTITGRRYVNLRLSNWGATILDFGGSGTAVAAAPFGRAPFEVFRAASSSSEGGINDSGRMAFAGREENSHGLRDAYLSDQGMTPLPLPELGEDAFQQPMLVDAAGRIVTRIEFENPDSHDVYRYSDGSGWENMTASRLPAGAVVQLSAGFPPNGAISPEGDFVFAVAHNQTELTRRYEIWLWDDSRGEMFPVLNYTSQHSFDFLGRPNPLNGLAAQFSSGKDLWLAVSRSISNELTEFKSLYRRGDGTSIDLQQLLPAGMSIVPNIEAHAMNDDGDLWLAAIDNSTQLYTYFLYQDGRLSPVLETTDQFIFLPVLNNAHEVYFWHDGGFSLSQQNLMRFTIRIPEPSSLGLALLAVGVAGGLRVRRRLATGDSSPPPRPAQAFAASEVKANALE